MNVTDYWWEPVVPFWGDGAMCLNLLWYPLSLSLVECGISAFMCVDAGVFQKAFRASGTNN